MTQMTPIPGLTSAPAAADAMPTAAPTPVGEQALTGIVSFNDRVTLAVKALFPNATRTDRALIVDGVLTGSILIATAMLYDLCRRVRAPFVRNLLKMGVLIAAVLGLIVTWIPGALDWFETPDGARIGGSGLTIFTAFVIAALVWEGFNRIMVDQYQGRVDARSHRFRTLVPLFRRVIFLFLVAITGLTALTEVGVNVGPLLAGAGIIGIALGFGAQKLAQDFITGLFIVLEDAIALGDIVTIDSHTGVVEDMTLRTVRLRDGAGAVHILPFSTVQAIVNLTKEKAYAVIDIGVAYNTELLAVEGAIHAIVDAMKLEEDWRETLTDEVELFGVERLEASAIIYRFRLACRPNDQFRLKRELYRRILIAFAAAKIEIPYPTVMNVSPKTASNSPAPATPSDG